jgi:type VI secretion system protein ImpC
MAKAESQDQAAGGQEATETAEQEAGLLDQIVEEGRFGEQPQQKERGKTLVKQFVSEVLEGSIAVSPDTESMLNARIAEIDRLVTRQLKEIMHHEKFQDLESTWRGLKYLVDESETGTMLRIRVFNATKDELLRDLQRAPEFDQSALFKKVYEEEYGVFGGEPYGCLVGDYEFDNSGKDVELLERISEVAAASHAPFISGASPDMFNLESYTDLDKPRDLSKIFDSTEYARWKSFRESEDSRYTALTGPRMLLREPYDPESVEVETFNFAEDLDGMEHEDFLWANSAWALAARVTDSFAKHGWCATIRGVESGGLVENLPVYTYKTDSGDVAMKCPTEVQITDRREKELADLGFAPLVHQKGTPNAAFFSVQSCQKPKEYDTEEATANARISAQLPYIFAVSRFSHYLKAMMRDKIGGYMSRSEAETFLNNWIANYVVGNEDASAEVKAKRPLREARIDVVEQPDKPGAYRAVAFLRPHFQLDELSVSMRLVADLPEPVR